MCKKEQLPDVDLWKRDILAAMKKNPDPEFAINVIYELCAKGDIDALTKITRIAASSLADARRNEQLAYLMSILG